jgi:hypothetical protein
MPEPVMTEEPLQFGQGGRLLGILSGPALPSTTRGLPVFVLLNAGSLHRVGPARLHVRLARELACLGFSSLRVDLAGTGDSPHRPGLTNAESVAADCKEIVEVLDSRLGRSPLILGGLCSAADNAIRLTLEEPRIVGMLLLDPICFPDAGFNMRALVQKYLSPVRYIAALKRRIRNLKAPRQNKAGPGPSVEYWATRDLPTREQLRAAFIAIREREGRVLSVFTRYARPYCNQAGQLERVLQVEGYRQFCTELHWPWAEHTFPLELHRRRLIEHIKAWAKDYACSTAQGALLPAASVGLDGVQYAS